MGVGGEKKTTGQRRYTRDTCEYVCMNETQIDKKEMGKREKKEEIGGEEEF